MFWVFAEGWLQAYAGLSGAHSLWDFLKDDMPIRPDTLQ